MALWRSGDAAVCKTAYTGSIPVGASSALVLTAGWRRSAGFLVGASMVLATVYVV